MVRKVREGLWEVDGGSREHNFAVSIQWVRYLTLDGHGFLTCSGDVLMKTGGPFRQLMKIGTSLFKNAGYIGPVI
jgi:hypothetical protein